MSQFIYLNNVSKSFFLNRINIFIINCTALHLAVKKESVEIVKLLISYDNIDVNILSI